MKKRVVSILLSLLLLLSLIPLTASPARAATSGPICIENLPPAFPTAEKESDLQKHGFHWADGETPTLTLRNLTVVGSITIWEPNVTLELQGDNAIIYDSSGGVNSMVPGTLTIKGGEGGGSLNLTATQSEEKGLAIRQLMGSIVIDGCEVIIDHKARNLNMPTAVGIDETPNDADAYSFPTSVLYSLQVRNGARLYVEGGNVVAGHMLIDGEDSSVDISGVGTVLAALMCCLLEINHGSLRAIGGNAANGVFSMSDTDVTQDSLRMNGGSLYTASMRTKSFTIEDLTTALNGVQAAFFGGDMRIGNGSVMDFYSSASDAVIVTGNAYFNGEYTLFAATGSMATGFSGLLGAYAYRLANLAGEQKSEITVSPFGPHPKIIKGSNTRYISDTANDLAGQQELRFSAGWNIPLIGGIFTKGWAENSGGTILKRLKILPGLLLNPCGPVPESEVGVPILPIDAAAQISPSGGIAPYTYSIAGPDWLKIDTVTGVLSGKPEQKAPATEAVITVTDSDTKYGGPRNTETVTITVGEVKGPPLEFFNNGFDIPPSKRGEAITPVDVTTGVFGGLPPYNFVMTNKPDWLDITPAGIIKGTPPEKADAIIGAVTITVTDFEGTQKSITIDVGPVTGEPLVFDGDYSIEASTVGTSITPVVVSGGVSGGIAPYIFSIVPGPGVPTWLKINPATGEITGTPTAALPGGATVTVKVIDCASLQESATNTVAVGPVASSLTYLDSSEYDIPRSYNNPGVAITPVDTLGGVIGGVKPYNFSKVEGPDWLKIDPGTGVITGTPTGTAYAAGTTAVFKVKDDMGLEDTITINVGPVSSLRLADWNSTYSRPYQVFEGPNGVELYDGQTGDYRVVQHPHAGVTGGATPYVWTISEGPDWVEISTLGSAALGVLDKNPPGSTSKGCLFGVRTDGPRPATTAVVTVTDANGVSESITIIIGAITTGSTAFGLTATPAHAIPARVLGEQINPPVDVSANVVGGERDWHYSIVGAKPDWLDIDPDTGAITGIPTLPEHVGGETTITVMVEDSATPIPASATIEVTVGAVYASPLLFEKPANSDIPPSMVGEDIEPVDCGSGVSGGTPEYTFSLSNNLGWLTIDADGVIHGTPTAAAPATTIAVIVTDSTLPTPESRSIPVSVGEVSASPDPLVFTDSDDYDVPSLFVGETFSVDLDGSVTGGTGTYTFTLIGPDWLTITGGSVISTKPGKPDTVSAARTAVVVVTDTAGNSGTIPINVGAVKALPVPPVFTDSGDYDIPAGTAGVPIAPVNLRAAVSGGTEPLTFTFETPTWLIIHPTTGVITGTPPSASESTTVTIIVTDGTGASDSITIDIGAMDASPARPLIYAKLPGYDIPAGQAGKPITPVNITGGASGGTAPYTFGAVGLPAGLSMTAGVISGAPLAAAAAAEATITVTDSASATAEITITIGAVGPGPLVFAYSAAYDIPESTAGIKIDTVDVSPVVSGGTKPYAFSISGPAWLSIDRLTGEIDGTPTKLAGETTATVVVRDAANKVDSFTIKVGAVTGDDLLTFVKGDFDVPAGVEGTAIAPIDVSGGVSGGTESYTFTMDGPAWLLEWLHISADGLIEGTPPTATEVTTATITVDDGENTASIEIVVWAMTSEQPRLQFLKEVWYFIPESMEGKAIKDLSIFDSVTGGTPSYSFEISSPGAPWLKIDANGIISGTPDIGPAGATTAIITVTDKALFPASRNIEIQVGAVSPKPMEFNKPLNYTVPASVENESIKAIDISGWASGGTRPYTFTISSPTASWLRIDDPSTGVITGTPANAFQATTATVTATDSTGKLMTVTINVGQVTAPLSCTQHITSIPVSQANSPIQTVRAFAATGGTPPYTFSMTGQPVGIVIDANGWISGTPTTPNSGSTIATIIVRDSLNAQVKPNFTITFGRVNGVVIPLNFTDSDTFDIPASTAGVGIASVDVSTGVTGGAGTRIYSVSLPWLSISSGGVITGTPPAAAAATTATVTVKDNTGSKSIEIKVGAVAAAGGTLTFTPPPGIDIPAGTAGTAITPIDVSGGAAGGTGPYEYSMTGNPSWLKIDPKTGIITGTPTGASSETTVTITVKDKTGATVSFQIKIGAITGNGNNGGTTTRKKIFTTRYDSTFFNWILFILLFGWIWMWF